MHFSNRIISALLVLLVFLIPDIYSSEKPELELPEIVITALSPELMRASKKSYHQVDITSWMELVAGTVTRTQLDLPEFLDLSSTPSLYDSRKESRSCLLGFLGPIMGTKGRIRAAAKAETEKKWRKAIEL